MSILARLELHTLRALQLLVGAIMIAAVAVNFANVIGRYVFLRPFVWAEEVMQFMNVWAVMLGAAVITRYGSHLRMDAVYHYAPAGVRRALDALSNLVALAVALYVIREAVGMVRMMAATGQRSVIAGVPMHLMYLALPIGFACTALFLVLWWLVGGRGASVAAEAPEMDRSRGPA